MPNRANSMAITPLLLPEDCVAVSCDHPKMMAAHTATSAHETKSRTARHRRLYLFFGCMDEVDIVFGRIEINTLCIL